MRLPDDLAWLITVAKSGKIVDHSYPEIPDLCKQIEVLPPDTPVTYITELFSGLNILYNHENNSLFETFHQIFEDPTMGRKGFPRILEEDSEARGHASNNVISLDKEPETRKCDGNPVTRHAESEALGIASLDKISLNKEPGMREWDRSPVTRHADSEDSESASYDETLLNVWDQDHMTSSEDSSLGFKAHGDVQHNRNSYSRFPCDDPFDCDLFKDEVITSFVSKYDDILSYTSGTLEGRKANQVSKISLNKEPEIRDLDGNSVTSYDTSEDSDSGPEAHEADLHKRTDLYHDPFDCYIFNDEVIMHFISENDKILSDTSNSTDGPKRRRPLKKIKKTGSRPRSLTKRGPARIGGVYASRKKQNPSGLTGSKVENRTTDPQKDNGTKLVHSDSQRQSKHYRDETDFFQDDSYEHHINNVKKLVDSDSQSQSKHHGDEDVFQEATLKHQKEDSKNIENKKNQDGDSQSWSDEVDAPEESPGVGDEVDVPRVSQYRITTRFSALLAEREKKNRELREKGEPELGELERKTYTEFGISREKRKKKRSIKSRTIQAPTSKASHHDAARKDGPDQTQRGGRTSTLSASIKDIPANSPYDMPTPNPNAEDWTENLIAQLLTHEPQELAELLRGQDQSMIASIFYQASVLASNGKINMSQNEHGEVIVSKVITE